MNRTAAEVEAEVEASRNDLDRNVEALKQKMSPGQLFDEAARMMGGTGQQVASKFAEQAKANPMPLAVMGLGLAWLMVSQNRSSAGGGGLHETRSYAPRQTYGAYGADMSGESSDGLKEKVGDAVSAMGEKASHMMEGAREKLSDGVETLRHTGKGVTSNLGSTADAMTRRASQVRHQATRTVVDAFESEPLLLAGLGLVVGAAIGAALPATEAENRLLGEPRDQLLAKGKEMAETGLQQATSAAHAAYDTVKSELQDGQAGGDLTEKVEGSARSGVQAAREQFEGPSSH